MAPKLPLPWMLRCYYTAGRSQKDSHGEVGKMTGESDVVAVFIVGHEGGVTEQLACCMRTGPAAVLASEGLAGEGGLATEMRGGHWLRRHSGGKSFPDGRKRRVARGTEPLRQRGTHTTKGRGRDPRCHLRGRTLQRQLAGVLHPCVCAHQPASSEPDSGICQAGGCSLWTQTAGRGAHLPGKVLPGLLDPEVLFHLFWTFLG